MGEARRNKQARRASTSAPPIIPRPVLAPPVFEARALWICAALIVINIAVYAPVRNYDFISFDDPQYVSENPNVSAGLTVRGIQWAFTTGHASNWHPLTWLSHMLDVQMFGLNAGPQHIVNLLFHIANSLLLFGILYKMTGALGRSGFVAALFAAHPLHVESVAWISERKDVLSTLLWMLTIWAYVAYARDPRPVRYALTAVLLGLGLMAKPMLVTLPFVLVLLDVWPLRRAAIEWPAILKSLKEKLPLIGLAVASSIVTFEVQRRGGAVSSLDAIPAGLRIANALSAYVGYVAKALWPAGLAILYPFPTSIPVWQVAGSIAVLGAISVAAFRYRTSQPYVIVGWLWYLGTLVPVVGFVQVGSQSMADRYMYVPLVGLSIILAWGLTDLAAKWRIGSIPLTTGAVLVVVACVGVSRQQVPAWKDSMTLWSRTLAVTKGNFRAHSALGSLLHERKNLKEAISHYEEAIRLKPDFAEGHLKLGAALADVGRTAEAVPHLKEALRLKPDYPEAHNNLGNAAAREGKIDEAIAHYNEALRLKPDDAGAHNGLGSALDDKGKISEAIEHYNEALRLKPDFAEVHNNMAAALLKEQKLGEALEHLLEATRIQPDNADFHYNAAMLLRQSGRSSEAREHFDAALKLNPSHQAARAALGSLETPTGR